MSAHHVNRNDRLAFTLVELLVAITLMSILGTMLSYALAGARQEARIKRAQSEVRMISQILQTKMNEIVMSKVELVYAPVCDPNLPVGDRNRFGWAPSKPIASESSRLVLMARRDLMRLVMPECRADLIYPPANLHFRSRHRNAGYVLANSAKLRTPSAWNRMRSVIGLRSAGQADNYYQLAGNVGSPSENAGIDSAILYGTNADYKAALDSDTRLALRCAVTDHSLDSAVRVSRVPVPDLGQYGSVRRDSDRQNPRSQHWQSGW